PIGGAAAIVHAPYRPRNLVTGKRPGDSFSLTWSVLSPVFSGVHGKPGAVIPGTPCRAYCRSYVERTSFSKMSTGFRGDISRNSRPLSIQAAQLQPQASAAPRPALGTPLPLVERSGRVTLYCW
ncbi:hypothetical protein BaRGS_00033251, partial [Batillaria attramentaria]